jgi:hypothetical protein
VASFVPTIIPIEKTAEFAELKAVITRCFAPEKVESVLKRIQSSGSRVRNFDAILENGVLDRVDDVLKKSGHTSRKLYEALTLSDQGQMREFYLSKLEEVNNELRSKFKKLYQYY